MSKIYLLNVGYNDDTVVYELVPKEVTRLKNKTMQDIVVSMQLNDIRNVVVDAGEPRVIDALQSQGFNVIKGRLPKMEDMT